jgi:hypothetical protein
MDERVRKLEADLRASKWCAAGAVFLLGAISLTAFQKAQRVSFAEIRVERLNVVEPDGTVRLAIANRERFAPATFYGKEYPGIRGGSAPGMAGMIYFNDEGTEMGGFGWSGKEIEPGTVRAVGMLTFDHYNQNEAVSLGFSDLEGRRRAGLTILDQPHVSIQPVADTLLLLQQMADGPERTRRMEALREGMVERGEVGATRLFVGRDRDEAAVVVLMDPQGHPRIRMAVDSAGMPRLEFLDEEGKVILHLPGSG